jgi:hypothetical protein
VEFRAPEVRIHPKSLAMDSKEPTDTWNNSAYFSIELGSPNPKVPSSE